jgi:hypothetical protein
MTFWANSAFEPKRNFMWKMTLLSGVEDSKSLEPFRMKKVSRPKMSVNAVEHNYLNRKYKFPGIVTWDNVTATVVDDVGGQTIDLIKDYLANSNYSEINKDTQLTAGQFSTLGKNKMVNGMSSAGGAAANVVIEQLNSEGETVETMYLYNAWLLSVTPSELDYSNEDLSTFDIELAYDWCSFEGPTE